MARRDSVPEWLNWLLSVVEPLIVLIITLLVGYATYWLVFGSSTSDHYNQLVQSIKTVNDNWKAALILILLLFYRTVRTFLEQAEEAWGVRKKKPIIGEPTEEANPPRKTEKHASSFHPA